MEEERRRVENMQHLTQACREYLNQQRGQKRPTMVLRTYNPTDNDGLLDCFRKFWAEEATPPTNNGMKEGRQDNFAYTDPMDFRTSVTIPQKMGVWPLWGSENRLPNIYMEWNYNNYKYSHNFNIKFMIDKQEDIYLHNYNREEIADELQTVQIFYPKFTDNPTRFPFDYYSDDEGDNADDDEFKGGFNNKIIMHSTIFPPEQKSYIYRPSVKSLIAARILLCVALAENLNEQYEENSEDASIDHISMWIEDAAANEFERWSDVTSLAGYGSYYAWNLYGGEMNYIDSKWQYVASPTSLMNRLKASGAVRDAIYQQKENEEQTYTEFWKDALKDATLMRMIEEHRRNPNEDTFRQMFQLASDIITIDRSDRYMPSIWEDAHIEFRFALNNNEFFAYDNFDIDPIKREMGQWMRKHLSLRL